MYHGASDEQLNGSAASNLHSAFYPVKIDNNNLAIELECSICHDKATGKHYGAGEFFEF